jgi:hypothetical protein
MTARLVRAALVLALLAFAAPVQAQSGILYGIANGFGTVADNRIYQVNPSNADLTNIVQVTLPGFTVTNSLSLVAQPGTGTLFAILQTQGAGPFARRLVTINPATGVATDIGNMGDAFSYLAFRSNGTLIGVTGDGANTPETLFTINTSTAQPTLMFALGNGADGEVIAFHSNGLLYHSSGNTVAEFESVNVDTQAVTPIGSLEDEMFAMGWVPSTNQFLGTDINSGLFSIDIATGARTLFGSMSDQLGAADNRGLAFVITAVPEPATITLFVAGAVGVGAYFLRKRRLSKKLDDLELRRA